MHVVCRFASALCPSKRPARLTAAGKVGGLHVAARFTHNGVQLMSPDHAATLARCRRMATAAMLAAAMNQRRPAALTLASQLADDQPWPSTPAPAAASGRGLTLAERRAGRDCSDRLLAVMDSVFRKLPPPGCTVAESHPRFRGGG